MLVYRAPLHRRDPELERGKLTPDSPDVRIDVEVRVLDSPDVRIDVEVRVLDSPDVRIDVEVRVLDSPDV